MRPRHLSLLRVRVEPVNFDTLARSLARREWCRRKWLRVAKRKTTYAVMRGYWLRRYVEADLKSAAYAVLLGVDVAYAVAAVNE